MMRDIARKMKGDVALEAIFARELMLASRVHVQKRNLRRVRGTPGGTELRVFSPHAPEVECIGKGKAHKAYEFGVKVLIATTLHRSAGAQFLTQVKALPGKPEPALGFDPMDGQTLAIVIPEIEAQIGRTLGRIHADAGYRGHNAPPGHRL